MAEPNLPYTIEEIRDIVEKVSSQKITDKPPGQSLKEYVRGFLIEGSFAPSGFLPGGELMLTRLLRREYVLEELIKTFPRRSRAELEAATDRIRGYSDSSSSVLVNAKKTYKAVFMTLVWIDATRSILDFIHDGSDIEDAVMPLVHRNEGFGRVSLCKMVTPILGKSLICGSQPQCFRRIPVPVRTNFERFQWMLFAPFFKPETEDNMFQFLDILAAPLPICTVEEAKTINYIDEQNNKVSGSIQVVHLHPYHDNLGPFSNDVRLISRLIAAAVSNTNALTYSSRKLIKNSQKLSCNSIGKTTIAYCTTTLRQLQRLLTPL
jgi:hypothetical protein